MNAATDRDVDAAVVDAYIECALWSSTEGEEGTPLDDRYGPEDIAEEARASMRAEIADFLRYVAEEGLDISGIESAQIGHDFWLTRNRHGAGFWDRGLGGARRQADDDRALLRGESDLYAGDDGRLYVS